MIRLSGHSFIDNSILPKVNRSFFPYISVQVTKKGKYMHECKASLPNINKSVMEEPTNSRCNVRIKNLSSVPNQEQYSQRRNVSKLVKLTFPRKSVQGSDGFHSNRESRAVNHMLSPILFKSRVNSDAFQSRVYASNSILRRRNLKWNSQMCEAKSKECLDKKMIRKCSVLINILKKAKLHNKIIC